MTSLATAVSTLVSLTPFAKPEIHNVSQRLVVFFLPQMDSATRYAGQNLVNCYKDVFHLIQSFAMLQEIMENSAW